MADEVQTSPSDDSTDVLPVTNHVTSLSDDTTSEDSSEDEGEGAMGYVLLPQDPETDPQDCACSEATSARPEGAELDDQEEHIQATGSLQDKVPDDMNKGA